MAHDERPGATCRGARFPAGDGLDSSAGRRRGEGGAGGGACGRGKSLDGGGATVVGRAGPACFRTAGLPRGPAHRVQMLSALGSCGKYRHNALTLTLSPLTPTSLTVSRQPYAMHHAPYAIHHTPYTRHIHHKPCTIHHAPYTIHHTQFKKKTNPKPLNPNSQTLNPNPLLTTRSRISSRSATSHRPLRASPLESPTGSSHRKCL